MVGGQLAARSGFPVLVAEDDGPTRLLLEREIADAGHPVRAVADGNAALVAMAKEPARIVVSDIRMPGGLDGVRLCAAIREAHPDTEVILVTAFASISTAIEGVKLGACDYLVKPFEDVGDVRRSLARASARIAQRLAQRKLVAGLRARTEGQAALLDRLPIAIIVADAEGGIHAKNRAAELLLKEGSGLSISPNGRLGLSRETDAQMLNQALASSCATNAAAPTTVELSRGEGRPPLRAVVAPLVHDALGETGRTPLAVVLLGEPGRNAISPHVEILRRLYGLTSAEGMLAARLVAGERIQEACDALGISLATARTHLSRIFSKTGTRRQGDLIGLILSGPALLAAGVQPVGRQA